jgi:signal transduction histidine kinase
MHKYYICWCLIALLALFSNSAFSNSSKLDSLKTELNKEELSDSLRIELLIKLGTETANTDQVLAVEFVNQAISLAQKNQYIKQLGNAYHRLAMIHYEKSNFSEADANLTKAVKYRRDVSDSLGIASSLRMLGVINYIRGEFAVALTYTTEAMRIFESIHDTIGISNTLNDLGIFYDKQDDRERALEYYMQAIEMRKLAGQEHTIAQLLNNVAIIYGRNEDFQMAYKYFQQAVDYASDNNQLRLLSAVYVNIAKISGMEGNYNKAGNYYMLALEIKQQIGDLWGMAYLYSGQAENYISQKLYDKALDSFEKSLNICIDLEMKDLMQDVLKDISTLFAETDRYKQAYEYHLRFFENFKESVDEENRNKIAEIKAGFDAEKKVREIEVLTREKEMQNMQLSRNRIYIILLIIAVILVLIISFFAIIAYKEKERYYKFAESINRELEDRVSREVDENRKKDIMLAQQNKQAVMGEMINNIAHQWRQPLNSLGIIIQNIEEAYNFGEVNAEYLNDKVLKSMNLIKYMDQTIDDFRYFFKPNKVKEHFEVKEAVKRTLEFAEEAIKKQGIKIEANIDNEVFASGFSNEYSQVVLNILNNSKDALVGSQVNKPWIKIELTKKDRKSLLTIEDNAGGIKESDIEKIFQPYFTSKESIGGTGLGLYMSRIIIEKNMDGKLSAINTDNGARFYILV